MTAWIIVGYFFAAFAIDGFFRGASFCKYVCPIGQFHFVTSLISPREVGIKSEETCQSCKTHSIAFGAIEQSRGCELDLFQPKKSGNLDCTFCLDCVKACPHHNVGMISICSGEDVAHGFLWIIAGKIVETDRLSAHCAAVRIWSVRECGGMVGPS